MLNLFGSSDRKLRRLVAKLRDNKATELEKAVAEKEIYNLLFTSNTSSGPSGATRQVSVATMRRLVHEEDGLPLLISRWPHEFAVQMLRLFCQEQEICRKLVLQMGFVQQLMRFVAKDLAPQHAQACLCRIFQHDNEQEMVHVALRAGIVQHVMEFQHKWHPPAICQVLGSLCDQLLHRSQQNKTRSRDFLQFAGNFQSAGGVTFLVQLLELQNCVFAHEALVTMTRMTSFPGFIEQLLTNEPANDKDQPLMDRIRKFTDNNFSDSIQQLAIDLIQKLESATARQHHQRVIKSLLTQLTEGTSDKNQDCGAHQCQALEEFHQFLNENEDSRLAFAREALAPLIHFWCRSTSDESQHLAAECVVLLINEPKGLSLLFDGKDVSQGEKMLQELVDVVTQAHRRERCKALWVLNRLANSRQQQACDLLLRCRVFASIFAIQASMPTHFSLTALCLICDMTRFACSHGNNKTRSEIVNQGGLRFLVNVVVLESVQIRRHALLALQQLLKQQLDASRLIDPQLLQEVCACVQRDPDESNSVNGESSSLEDSTAKEICQLWKQLLPKLESLVIPTRAKSASRGGRRELLGNTTQDQKSDHKAKLLDSVDHHTLLSERREGSSGSSWSMAETHISSFSSLSLPKAMAPATGSAGVNVKSRPTLVNQSVEVPVQPTTQFNASHSDAPYGGSPHHQAVEREEHSQLCENVERPSQEVEACADTGVRCTLTLSPQLSPPSPPPQPACIKMNGRKYMVNTAKRSMCYEGRNKLVEGCTEGFFGKAVMVKIYDRKMRLQGLNEVKQLHVLAQLPESRQFIVESVDFSENALFKDRPCMALVMQLGKKNLKQMIAEYGKRAISDQTVPTMTRIAECLHFLHSEARLVHCDVKLENVVNFADGFPEFKLIDFENCCRMHEFVPKDCSPEYCPPELAAELVKRHGTPAIQESASSSLRAAASFDVWCFGVLWMKYQMQGRVLVEFQGLPAFQIIQRIAHPDFTFDQTLRELDLSKPTERFLRDCTSRDPMSRPTFREILKNHVLRGFNTTLWKASQMQRQIHEMEQHVTSLLERQRQMIWQQEKLNLPCLWVLVPWQDHVDGSSDQKQATTLSRFCSWNSLGSQDMELKLLCDAAFDGEGLHSMIPCSACPSQHRIRVRASPRFVQSALPVLRCAAVLLKIAGVASAVVGLPGLGLLQNLVSGAFRGCDLPKWTEQVLSQAFDGDHAVESITNSVEGMMKLAKTNRELQQHMDDPDEIVAQLQDQSRAIRTCFESAEKQQLMRDLLQFVDPEKKWTELKIVGGLEKICDKAGSIRWVCSSHAQALGVSVAPSFAAGSTKSVRDRHPQANRSMGSFAA